MSEVLNRLRTIRGRLINIKGVLNQAARETLIKNQDDLKKLNQDQLMKGQKADGSDMPDYIEGSQQPSAPGKIKLFDTGLFQDGIEPLIETNEFEMIGAERKTPFLVAKYGEEILGISKESREKFLRENGAEFKRNVLKRLLK